MTQALCLNCGKIKHGAWKPCPNCEFEPQTEEQYTKYLLMTDHYQSIEMLQEAGARIQNGERLSFDEQTLKDMWISKEEIANIDKGVKRFFQLALTAIILLVVAVFYFFIFG